MSKELIQNWDELNDEQKASATAMLKYVPEEHTKQTHPAAQFFEKNNWVKIDKFIDENTAKLFYHYVQLEVQRLNFIDEKYGKGNYNQDVWGTFSDEHIIGDFSKYGDPLFDTLLDLSTEKVSELVGFDLTPNYTYHRFYTTGTDLFRHIDRSACEVSITMCLGYDISNVDGNVYPDYDWPMWVKCNDGTELPIHMKPGDMLIYRGDILEHWREPFIGLNHAQLFMHYNSKSADRPAYDSRPFLGLPSAFKTGESNIRVID